VPVNLSLTVPAGWLQTLSSLSTLVIVAAFVLHLAYFFWLRAWARRDERRMVADFEAFTRDLKHRSVLERGLPLSDQIEAFLADIKDVLDAPAKQADREALWQRMKILDEERRYLQSQSFETSYNICRTMIEAYPMAGILGTILAIGAALQTGKAAQDAAATVGSIVQYFGDAIWSTFAGLVAAMVLMFINSLVETRFRRLAENREHVRETITRAKREMSLARGGTA
jgi:biopolymer transport protein ExbB/TolQ